MWRPVPAKVSAACEPQRILGGPDSLFDTAAGNGAKIRETVLQTQAAAPLFQECIFEDFRVGNSEPVGAV